MRYIFFFSLSIFKNHFERFVGSFCLSVLKCLNVRVCTDARVLARVHTHTLSLSVRPSVCLSLSLHACVLKDLVVTKTFWSLFINKQNKKEREEKKREHDRKNFASLIRSMAVTYFLLCYSQMIYKKKIFTKDLYYEGRTRQRMTCVFVIRDVESLHGCFARIHALRRQPRPR